MPGSLMDLDEAMTVTKLNLVDDGNCYVVIGWQDDSFEMLLYVKDKVWKGRFTNKRLQGFSKNLNKTEEEYMKSVKSCLSYDRKDYIYELKSGLFYWKRILKEGPIVLEGFITVDLDTSPKRSQPELIEVLIALNSQLRQQLNYIKCKFRTLLTEYQKCMADTEEFLTLKIEMEKNLSSKFLNLLNVKKFKASSYDKKPVAYDSFRNILEVHE